jgi:mRNA-degrading endonuclease toxin of MazEF toxin-antitoxin module
MGRRTWKRTTLVAHSGLPKESVANVSQIAALDRSLLAKRVGKLPAAKLRLVLSGIDVVLGS